LLRGPEPAKLDIQLGCGAAMADDAMDQWVLSAFGVDPSAAASTANGEQQSAPGPGAGEWLARWRKLMTDNASELAALKKALVGKATQAGHEDQLPTLEGRWKTLQAELDDVQAGILDALSSANGEAADLAGVLKKPVSTARKALAGSAYLRQVDDTKVQSVGIVRRLQAELAALQKA
jgi:hypothetical protein